MAMFNSYVKLPEGTLLHYPNILSKKTWFLVTSSQLQFLPCYFLFGSPLVLASIHPFLRALSGHAREIFCAGRIARMTDLRGKTGLIQPGWCKAAIHGTAVVPSQHMSTDTEISWNICIAATTIYNLYNLYNQQFFQQMWSGWWIFQKSKSW